MNIVAFGVSMPLSRFMTELFPIFALLSLPTLIVVVLLQILSFANAGAFSDARREWIAPSIILTVISALFLRLVLYMFFSDASLLPAHAPYAGFLSLHVLLSSALAGFFFAWMALSRSRKFRPLNDVEYYVRWLLLSCLLMLLPNILLLLAMGLSWFPRLPWVINYSSIVSKIRSPLYFIAIPAYIWHLYILKHLVTLAKKSKILWVGSGIVYWIVPTFYFWLMEYLYSIGRIDMHFDYRIVFGTLFICVLGNFAIVRSVRRLVKEQLRFEEFVRESEQADR
ncbi:hypothetical protein ACO0LF_26660 [Undibacterium sp. Di27W]|uniref:hypothetical protein n=1 Tax=Undibacterium sp. Di27W TaxID=3413036 RepID=UPI003BF3D2F8